jgi:hypothetical protein
MDTFLYLSCCSVKLVVFSVRFVVLLVKFVVFSVRFIVFREEWRKLVLALCAMNGGELYFLWDEKHQIFKKNYFRMWNLAMFDWSIDGVCQTC